jgi:hypothetical protein
VADALSRWETGEEGQLAAVSAPTFTVFDDLCVETEVVAALRQLKEVQASRWGDKWKLVDGLITVGGKAYVFADSPCLLAMSARHPDGGAWHGA